MVEMPGGEAVPVRIVIQARTTSARLPAKVLLPLGGMPLSVLAARRAGRSGLEVVVAISDTPEDDVLARMIDDAGLAVLRGPLNDVLARFLMATADLPDEAICVRLTSDNPCPDADFVENLIDQFIRSGVRYLGYGNDGVWLPYGLSAEAFRVGDLRQAADAENAKEAPDDYVHEHVTPTLRANHAPAVRPALPGITRDLGHLRCTVDTLADYLRMAELFANKADPVNISWRELANEMAMKNARRPAGLVLGAVQLGLAYGITQEVGLMPEGEARSILAMAAVSGCVAIDTARAYGESEARIGAMLPPDADLPVITKLAPLDVEGQPTDRLASLVTDSIRASTSALRTGNLDTVLLHRAEHVGAANGVIWQRLIALRDQGRIGRLGVSVQSPEELLSALSLVDVEHVQLPFNLLDWRWDRCVAALRARPDVAVHVRSVFLQGLLLQRDSKRWPPLIDGTDASEILSQLSCLASELGRNNVADLCVAYVRAFSWIDGVVIGVDSAQQLEELAALFAREPLTWPEVVHVRQKLPHASERLLNPALWSNAGRR